MRGDKVMSKKKDRRPEQIIRDAESKLVREGASAGEVESLYGPIRKELASLQPKKKLVDAELERLKEKMKGEKTP